MTLNRFALSLMALPLLAVAGCSSRAYYAAPGPPPPPRYANPNALERIAGENGFRDGREAGRRDAIERRRYAPERTAAFRNTPGYDPHLGPIEVYRRDFRNAFVRGYNQGYGRP